MAASLYISAHTNTLLPEHIGSCVCSANSCVGQCSKRVDLVTYHTSQSHMIELPDQSPTQGRVFLFCCYLSPYFKLMVTPPVTDNRWEPSGTLACQFVTGVDTLCLGICKTKIENENKVEKSTMKSTLQQVKITLKQSTSYKQMSKRSI